MGTRTGSLTRTHATARERVNTATQYVQGTRISQTDRQTLVELSGWLARLAISQPSARSPPLSDWFHYPRSTHRSIKSQNHAPIQFSGSRILDPSTVLRFMDRCTVLSSHRCSLPPLSPLHSSIYLCPLSSVPLPTFLRLCLSSAIHVFSPSFFTHSILDPTHTHGSARLRISTLFGSAPILCSMFTYHYTSLNCTCGFSSVQCL